MAAPDPGGYKLLIVYDVNTDSMQSYYRFMLGRFVPLLAEMGLEMCDAWHTAYGHHPNRLIGFLARDLDTIRDVLHSDIWTALNQELNRFVSDFSFKVIPYREGFQFTQGGS
jgi:hypothetical protein